MANSMYYVQECPTCGRNLQIRIQYLGKKVVCRHCSSSFEAFETGPNQTPASLSGVALINRADELLNALEQRQTDTNITGGSQESPVLSNEALASNPLPTGPLPIGPLSTDDLSAGPLSAIPCSDQKLNKTSQEAPLNQHKKNTGPATPRSPK